MNTPVRSWTSITNPILRTAAEQGSKDHRSMTRTTCLVMFSIKARLITFSGGTIYRNLYPISLAANVERGLVGRDFNSSHIRTLTPLPLPHPLTLGLHTEKTETPLSHSLFSIFQWTLRKKVLWSALGHKFFFGKIDIFCPFWEVDGCRFDL